MGMATSIESNQVHIHNQKSVEFDLLSLNIGGQSTQLAPAASSLQTRVKPLEDLLRFVEAIEARIRAEVPVHQLLIIGGGPSACEVAACLHSRFSHLPTNNRPQITLLARQNPLLSHWAPSAGKLALRQLCRRGISVRLGEAGHAVRIEPNIVRTADAQLHPFDALIHAAGLSPPRLLQSSRLPLNHDGFLHIDPTLQAVGHPNVFGAGDCIAIEGQPLPRSGVHAECVELPC